MGELIRGGDPDSVFFCHKVGIGVRRTFPAASYDLGKIRFDHQIEIEGAGSNAFSGTNGKGVTYAKRCALCLTRSRLI